jgi:enoyl-CoA hydratase/carnithine racemase
VLTGAGEKAFCTGIDRMEQMGSGGDDTTDPDVVGSGSTPFMFNDPGDNIGPKSSDLWKPVIAAVNGMACGGAFYMLGEVEFIIAAEHATFFDPHVTYGMTAAFEPIHMSGIMPFGEIMRLSLLGNYERLSAGRAYEVGLVSEVAPKEELRDRAAWAANAIASQPPLAVEGTVRAIWSARELGQRQALRLGYAYVGLGTNQDSIAEGQKLFESGTRIDWRSR